MSHAIVSLDGKNGILKGSDARPSWTVTSLLTYIGMFGYSAFLDEYKRIESAGGACVGFYYVHEIVGDERNNFFLKMLFSKELGFTCFDTKDTGIHDFDYGYHIFENKIIVYRQGKLEDTYKYDKKELRHDIAMGIFEGDIRKVLKSKYNIIDNAND
jgi:hypothetical protein